MEGDRPWNIETSGKDVMLHVGGETIKLKWFRAGDMQRDLKRAHRDAKPDDIDERVDDLRNAGYRNP